MAQSKKKAVLFLCTGNYYRSRFAEVFFNSVAGKMGLPWTATSRALALNPETRNVGPMALGAIEALRAKSIEAAEAVTRLPKQVTNEELETADRIIALKQTEHEPMVTERHPEWNAKVEYWHVDDAPEVLPQIEQEVMALVARILGGGARPATEVTKTVAAKPKEPAKKPVTLKVGRETAGRRGKGVTTVFDTPLSETALLDLAGQLKQKCGTGGTVKDGRIEIQGDQRERIVAELEKLGYKVKRSGG